MPKDSRQDKSDREILLELANGVAALMQSAPRIERLILEHQAWLSTHERRLDSHGARLVVVEGALGLGTRISMDRATPAPFPTALPPPRAPMPSLSELDEEITMNGTRRVSGPVEQVQALIDARVKYLHVEEQRNSDAATTQAVRLTVRKGFSLGGITVISGAVLGLFTLFWLALKSYIDKLVGH